MNPGMRGGGPGRGRARKPTLPEKLPDDGPLGRGLDLLRQAVGGRPPGAPPGDIPREAPSFGKLMDHMPIDGHVWVVADPLCGLEIGAPVLVPADTPTLRETALVKMESTSYIVRVERMAVEEVPSFRLDIEERMRSAVGAITPRAGGPDPAPLVARLPLLSGAGSSRVLALPYKPKGLPRMAFGDLIEALPDTLPEHWPLHGPMSLKWVLSFCHSQTGALCNARVSQFMQLTRLGFSDGSMTEYAVIAKTIEFGLLHDQLSVSSLASFELLSRRFQLIEERYKMRLPQLDAVKGQLDPEQDTGLFLGLGTAAMAGRLAICVMPELAEFLGQELAKEASISKGRIKAHELRQQLNRLGGNKKGGGKAAHDDG
jgi:hypothetical protein